ncbi:hypothetical protein O3G_MSEX000317 [Manduca sexta]|nr:hypothetical protein O3G_MSEX000317 [Manduca sexta]
MHRLASRSCILRERNKRGGRRAGHLPPRRYHRPPLQPGIGCSRRSSIYRDIGLPNKNIQKRRPIRLVQRSWTFIFENSTPHHTVSGYMGHVK